MNVYRALAQEPSWVVTMRDINGNEVRLALSGFLSDCDDKSNHESLKRMRTTIANAIIAGTSCSFAFEFNGINLAGFQVISLEQA